MTNIWGYTSKINVSTWDQIIPITFTWTINAFQVAVQKSLSLPCCEIYLLSDNTADCWVQPDTQITDSTKLSLTQATYFVNIFN